MDRPIGLGALQTGQWQQLQDYAERFEQAWQSLEGKAETVDLAQFLPPRDDPLRPAVLHELIKTDLEIRWRRGQGLDLEQYVVGFPELGPVKALAPQLIYEEYRVRQVYGDKPVLASYEVRFPDQFVEVQRLFHDQPVPTLSVAAPAQPTAAGAPDGAHPSVLPTRSVGPFVPLESASPQSVAARGIQQVVDVGGGYTLVKFLGRGGFGEVSRAEAPGGIPVAIKIINRPLDHEESQRELHSLDLIKRLRHPYLLQTQAFFPQEDRIYIIMELADGSLRDRVKECRQARMVGIPPAELVRYFKESAEALDYLHSEKVLHRDIKPDNILLLKRHAKVADFGLARLAESSRMMSASGSGTPAFMAPEVWRGKVSEHSDQYSLAITYAELRLDRRLFEAADMMALMIAHVHSTPDLSPLAPAEQQVLLKALAKEADQRFPSCVEFTQALEEALASELGRTGLDQGGGRPGQRPVSGAQTDMDAPDKNAAVSQEPGPNEAVFKSLLGEAIGPVVLNRDLPSALEPPPLVVQPSQDDWRKPPPPPPALPQKWRWLIPTLVGVVFAGLLVPVALLLMGRSTNGQNNKDNLHTKAVETLDGVLPPNCEPAPGAVIRTLDGKNYYRKIEFKLDDATPVPFLLIPKGRGDDPATFYIMENKVSVGLFRKFATANQVKNNSWEAGGLSAGKDLGTSNEQLPAFRVTVVDAHRFAYWMKGKLPTAQQWNKAAGLYEPNKEGGPFAEGPYTGPLEKNDPAQVAVNRGEEGPMNVGEAAKDVSFFGCRDMAGNGLEWTRDVLTPLGINQVTYNYKPNPDDRVMLRGHSYAHPQPYRYNDMQEARRAETQDYIEASPFISFRVVIEP